MKTIYKTLAFASVIIFIMTFASPVTYSQEYASDPQFKVKIDFNRWHDVNELWDDMRRLEKAFPKFLKMGSAGKSYEWRLCSKLDCSFHLWAGRNPLHETMVFPSLIY